MHLPSHIDITWLISSKNAAQRFCRAEYPKIRMTCIPKPKLQIDEPTKWTFPPNPWRRSSQSSKNHVLGSVSSIETQGYSLSEKCQQCPVGASYTDGMELTRKSCMIVYFMSHTVIQTTSSPFRSLLISCLANLTVST